MSEDFSGETRGTPLQIPPGWQVEEGKLSRMVQTQNWKETLFVVNGIAVLAESHYHHPDLEVTYRKIRITLWSHDVNQITERDVRLAFTIHDWLTKVGY